MPHINLLPWREELRKRRQREFSILAGISVLLMLGVIAIVHVQFNGFLDHQKQRNAFLEQHIVRLNKKISEIKTLDEEKRRLLARMEIIQELQASRPEVVHLFDEMVTTLPDGTYYTRISQAANKLSLEGVAQSNARVSSLMRTLEGSDWLANPELVEITADTKNTGGGLRMSNFKLRIQQSKPDSSNNDEGESG